VQLRIRDVSLSQGGVAHILPVVSSGPAHKLFTVFTELPHIAHYSNNIYPITGHEGPEGGGGRGIDLLIRDHGGRRGWVVSTTASHPGRCSPGKDPVPIVQEAGWAPRPVWACSKLSPPPDWIPGPSSP
jgi:hypothetical protein